MSGYSFNVLTADRLIIDTEVRIIDLFFPTPAIKS
jgi:hypothetical protein